jgi:hypothetical protein
MSFINDTTNVFIEHWGGYLECKNGEHCLLPEEKRFDIMVLCTPMTTGPIRTQAYCHCDFNLAGPDCSEITPGTEFRSAVFAVSMLIALVVLPLSIREIYARSRPLKANAVYASLWLSLFGCVFNTLWGGLGLYFTIAAPSKPGFALSRIIFVYAAIPGTLACSFAAAMIISLAWRQVVIDSDFKNKGDKAAIEKREKHIKHVVVVLCVVMFLAIGIALTVVSVSMASVLLTAFNLFGAIFFFRSGKSFQRNLSSTFGVTDTVGDKKMSPEMQCLMAAGKANKFMTHGMIWVVVGAVFVIVAQTFIGMPGVVGEFEVAAIPGAILSAANALSQLEVTLYSNRVRMIGVNRRKKNRVKPSANGQSTVSSSSMNDSSSVTTETVRQFNET